MPRRLLVIALCAWLCAPGCRSRSHEKLPKLGQIGEFRLLDQASRPVRNADLRGNVWVAAFMFTRCPTICPRITRRMSELASAAKQEGVKLRLVSFSVDPEYDTSAVLRNYIREFALDDSSWSFLTGDNQAVRKTAVESFKMAVEGQADGGGEHFGIVHGSHLVLVDRNLEIRGFYRSSDADVVARLVADAALLAQ